MILRLIIIIFISSCLQICIALSSNHLKSKSHASSADLHHGLCGCDRRSAFAAIGLGCTTVLYSPAPVSAIASADTTTLEKARSDLLEAIDSNENEQEILQLIDRLHLMDPCQGRGATFAEDLDGKWALLWSAKADAFSPLLKLPRPWKPQSFQYLGPAAALEVGPGRVAQGLTSGILGPMQLWLSSGVAPSTVDPSVLDILPPFRFQLGGRFQSGRRKLTIVQANSDAEFRQVNARSQTAQQAPKNSYRQLYLERNGAGSLRISTISAGDPVIVGAIFVHQKL
jgi:hypothetical protein